MRDGWDSRHFEDCIDRVKYPRKIPRKEFLDSGPFPVVSQEQDFINGYWDNEDDLFKVERPIVVFGDHTTVLKYVDFDFVLGADGVKVLKPKRFINPRYFYYFLMSVPLKGLGYARHYRLLKELTVYFPSLPEQKRIVEVLDAAFERIARAIANTERNLNNAKELISSSVQSVFDEIPETEYQPLGTVTKNLDSKRVPITKSKRVAGAIPYYGASGIVDHVAEHIFDEDLLLVSEDGANLLARKYPIAFSISGKSWVNNHAHVLRFNNIVSQHYLEFYLNSISLAPWVSGMAQPKLNQKALNSIPVPFPSIEEQQRVVLRLSEIRQGADSLFGQSADKLALLHELKQSILQNPFSGELIAEAEEAKEEAVA